MYIFWLLMLPAVFNSFIFNLFGIRALFFTVFHREGKYLNFIAIQYSRLSIVLKWVFIRIVSDLLRQHKTKLQPTKHIAFCLKKSRLIKVNTIVIISLFQKHQSLLTNISWRNDTSDLLFKYVLLSIATPLKYFFIVINQMYTFDLISFQKISDYMYML